MSRKKRGPFGEAESFSNFSPFISNAVLVARALSWLRELEWLELARRRVGRIHGFYKAVTFCVLVGTHSRPEATSCYEKFLVRFGFLCSWFLLRIHYSSNEIRPTLFLNKKCKHSNEIRLCQTQTLFTR